MTLEAVLLAIFLTILSFGIASIGFLFVGKYHQPGYPRASLTTDTSMTEAEKAEHLLHFPFLGRKEAWDAYGLPDINEILIIEDDTDLMYLLYDFTYYQQYQQNSPVAFSEFPEIFQIISTVIKLNLDMKKNGYKDFFSDANEGQYRQSDHYLSKIGAFMTSRLTAGAVEIFKNIGPDSLSFDDEVYTHNLAQLDKEFKASREDLVLLCATYVRKNKRELELYGRR